MKTILYRLRHYAFLVIGLAVSVVTLLPVMSQTVFAGGQVQSRQIEMSDSTPGQAGVTYNVSFKATSAATVGGILVDFCADSPIINSTSCTFPTGFTLGTTVTVSGLTGFTTNTGWVTTNSLQCGAAASNFQVLELTSATSFAPSNFSTTPINFQITGVTNPSTTGTFYARIYTFDTAAHTPSAATYCPTGTTRGSSFTGNLDYGGDALSTVTQIAITATVQETLVFCVSGSTPIGAGCSSGVTTPTLTLGSGTPPVLHTSGDAVPAYTQLSTNALSGVIVRMKATNACTNGGMTTSPPDTGAGCTNIPGLGGSAVTFTSGTADWGMCVAPGSGVTPDANYKDTTNSCPTTFNSTSEYGMDGANLTGTYGDPIYSTGGAVNSSNSTLVFAAQAANTTPAGVYEANEILIATGTF